MSQLAQQITQGNKANCCLLLICGIPGSGKSRIAAALLSAAAADGVAASVIDFDKQTPLETLGEGEFNPEKWKVRGKDPMNNL